MAKFRGCAIFQTQVIRQRVSLKIIVFSMETPCWSLPEELQNGGQKPAETSGQGLEFTLALSKRLFFLLPLKTFASALLTTYWLLRTRKHKANRYFRTRNMLHYCYPKIMPMSLIVTRAATWRRLLIRIKRCVILDFGFDS